jgi:hypothetical protein
MNLMTREQRTAVQNALGFTVAADPDATVRSTVARLVVANNRGDDYNLGDLASELERTGIDLKDDYDEADALAHATEQEGLL